MLSSSSSPRRGRGGCDGCAPGTARRLPTAACCWAPSTTPNGRRLRPLAQLRLDGVQDRLAVRVAALVVAHLAELGRAQAAQPAHDLVRGQVVVGENREVRPHPGHAAGAVGLGERARGRADGAPAGARRLAARRADGTARRPTRARGAALDLVAAAPEQLLEVLQHVVRLRAAALDEAGGDALRVRRGHPAALDRLAEDLLDAVAREQHHLHRADQVLAESLTELGDGLGLDAGTASAARRGLRGGLRGLACLLLASARLPALLGGGAPLRRRCARGRCGGARAGGRAAARTRRRAARPARLLSASRTSAAATLSHLLPLLGPAN